MGALPDRAFLTLLRMLRLEEGTKENRDGKRKRRWRQLTVRVEHTRTQQGLKWRRLHN